MILVETDIGKNKHSYWIYKNDSGEITKTLIDNIKPYVKKDVLIGTEYTGH